MLVVVDTNVLVSGILSHAGPPGVIVRKINAGELRLCYDERMVFEYEDVLARRELALPEAEVAVLLSRIRRWGILVAGKPLPAPLPDPDDEVFLEAALAATAECLITGNARHFPPSCCQGVRVLSPRAFLDFYAARNQ